MKTDKAVVVTGAAGGIGSMLCAGFLKEGYQVWAVDPNQAGLEALKEKLSKYGKQLETSPEDVTNEGQMRALIGRIQQASHSLVIWVNNAGISGAGRFDKVSVETMKRVIDINLTAVMVNSRLALDRMKEQGSGVIINIASVAGHLPAPYLAAYSASKHGVVGFTRALQGELTLKRSPVRTLLVCPGFVDTPMVHAKEGGLVMPDWMNFALAAPQVVADHIISAVRSGKREIFPSWNGKLLMAMAKVVPGFRERGTTLFSSHSLKDYFFNRPNLP